MTDRAYLAWTQIEAEPNVDANVHPDGVAGTGALGSVTPSIAASQDTWQFDSQASLGSVKATVSGVLAGLEGTSGLGTASPGGGNAAYLAWTQIETWQSNNRSVDVDGVSGTGVVSSPKATVSGRPAGVTGHAGLPGQVTPQVGTGTRAFLAWTQIQFSPSNNVIVSLSGHGVSGHGTLGTVTPFAGYAVTPDGVTGSGAVGDLLVETDRVAPGLAGNGALGTVLPESLNYGRLGTVVVSWRYTVGSYSGRGYLGQVGADVSGSDTAIEPGSVYASGALGSGVVLVEGLPSGVSGAGTLGEVTPEQTIHVEVKVDGAAGTSALGDAAALVSGVPTGLSGVSSLGSVEEQSDSVVVLLGVSGQGHLGSFAAVGAPPPPPALPISSADGAVGGGGGKSIKVQDLPTFKRLDKRIKQGWKLGDILEDLKNVEEEEPPAEEAPRQMEAPELLARIQALVDKASTKEEVVKALEKEQMTLEEEEDADILLLFSRVV